MFQDFRRFFPGLMILLFLAATLSGTAFAAGGATPAGQTAPATIDPQRNAQEDAYLNRQAEALLNTVKETITRLPPQYPEPGERRLALLLMDGVLHDVYAAQRPPVQAFYHRQMEEALASLESTRVTEGAVIWKLYNMAFIVRTASVTLAFDLVSGRSAKADGFTAPDALMDRFVAQCDALFISHPHGDHIEERIAQAFLDQGKPVSAPPSLWAGKPFGPQLTRLQRDADLVQTLPVQQGARKLAVVIYPGHQMKGIDNNVSLVTTPEGLTFCHLGDQINEGDYMEDFGWIDAVARQHHVDVMMPACWTNDISRMVQGMDPALVIPGHQNELGHPIDDRVPFWGDAAFLGLTYPELLQSGRPVAVMTWGESFHYTPKP